MPTRPTTPYGPWTAAWGGLALLATVNGLSRGLYARRLGEDRAHQISSATLVAALLPYAGAVERRWPLPTAGAGSEDRHNLGRLDRGLRVRLRALRRQAELASPPSRLRPPPWPALARGPRCRRDDAHGGARTPLTTGSLTIRRVYPRTLPAATPSEVPGVPGRPGMAPDGRADCFRYRRQSVGVHGQMVTTSSARPSGARRTGRRRLCRCRTPRRRLGTW